MPPIHLLRHGEVENPRHVIYADLSGYRLSERGRRQAQEAAERLAQAPVSAVVTSPLERAVETAATLAAPHGCQPIVDEGLIEWRLGSRWAGVSWEDLPRRFPGELEAYLEQPESLSFGSESLEDLAARVAAVVTGWCSRVPTGELVFVSHQDPIQAARRALGGRSLADFHADKPGHASLVTMTRRDAGAIGWDEVSYWEPDQGVRFPPIGGSPPP